MQPKPAFNDWSVEFNDHDIMVMNEIVGFLNESSDDFYPLIRQNAKTGVSLLRSISGCQKSLNGKECQNQIVKYGMCHIHWKKWKKKNPWLKYPGQY